MVRFKNRYFLFDLIFAATNSAADTNKQLQWNEKLIAQHLRESIQLLFGDYGYAVCAHSIQGILNMAIIISNI
jgi:RNase P/RNase MRP subunit POP5